MHERNETALSRKQELIVRRNNLLKTAGAFLVIISVFIFGSIAWFASNKQVGGKGMNIKVMDNKIYCDSTIYNYTANNTAQTAESLELLQYDTVFSNNNDHTYGAIRLEVYGSTLEMSGTLDITLERVLNNDTASVNSSYISSVTKYKAVTLTTVPETAADVLSTVHTVAGDQQFQKFVTNSSKQDSLTFSVDYTAANWYDDKLYIYIYLDYDDELVKAYVHNALSNILTLGNGIDVANDISAIVISKHEQ